MLELINTNDEVEVVGCLTRECEQHLLCSLENKTAHVSKTEIDCIIFYDEALSKHMGIDDVNPVRIFSKLEIKGHNIESAVIGTKGESLLAYFEVYLYDILRRTWPKEKKENIDTVTEEILSKIKYTMETKNIMLAPEYVW